MAGVQNFFPNFHDDHMLIIDDSTLICNHNTDHRCKNYYQMRHSITLIIDDLRFFRQTFTKTILRQYLSILSDRRYRFRYID